MPNAINMTPTFEAAVNMCIIALENGTNEGKQIAREELLRYGRELDRLASQSRSAFAVDDVAVEGE